MGQSQAKSAPAGGGASVHPRPFPIPNSTTMPHVTMSPLALDVSIGTDADADADAGAHSPIKSCATPYSPYPAASPPLEASLESCPRTSSLTTPPGPLLSTSRTGKISRKLSRRTKGSSKTTGGRAASSLKTFSPTTGITPGLLASPRSPAPADGDVPNTNAVPSLSASVDSAPTISLGRSTSLMRKFSRRPLGPAVPNASRGATSSNCPTAGIARVVSNSSKSRKSLRESMRAFEELVEAAEARSGISPPPTHTRTRSFGTGRASRASRASRGTVPASLATPPGLPQAMPPPPLPRPFSPPARIAMPLPRGANEIPSTPSPPGRIVPISPHTPRHLAPSSPGTSTSRAGEIASPRRAEREWRAKIAALSAHAAAGTLPTGEASLGHKTISTTPLRGGPVPPRRPARKGTADSGSGGAPSADSHILLTPTQSSPAPDAIVAIASSGPGASVREAIGTPARSLASRRSFDTLGFHHFVSPSRASSAGVAALDQAGTIRERKASVPLSVTSSFYFDPKAGTRTSTRPSSLAVHVLLDRDPEETCSQPSDGDTDCGITPQAQEQGSLRQLYIHPFAALCPESPPPPLAQSEEPACQLETGTPTASRFAPSTHTPVGGSKARHGSASIIVEAPSSIRSGRTSPHHPSFESLLSPEETSGSGERPALVDLRPSGDTHVGISTPRGTACLSPIATTTATAHSPKPLNLSSSLEDRSFDGVLSTTPGERLDNVHPYAFQPSMAPPHPMISPDRSPASPHSRARDSTTTTNPRPLHLETHRRAPAPPASPPMRAGGFATPASPTLPARKARRDGAPLPKHQVIGTSRAMTKGLRGVDLTPGLQEGSRPKTGMTMTELERWLAETNVTSA